MTVTTTTNNENFEGNGVATVFPFTFRFFMPGDLVVTRVDNATGVELVLDLGADYSVQGAGNADGGSVTLLSGPLASGFTLNVARVLSPVQLTEFINQGKFFPEIHEQAFDYLTMLMQQSASGSERSLLTPITDPSVVSRTIPNSTARALRVLSFLADGSPSVSGLTLEEIEQQVPLSQQAAQQAAASAGSASSSASSALASSDLAMKWAENPEDVPVETGKFSAKHYAAKAAAAVVWATQPIGVPIPIWDHITGVAIPPTNDPAYRYIKLSVMDSYNTGVLTTESISGVTPLVIATAVISDAGSPLNGRTVQLINTERRVLRAGSSGTIQADALQNIVGEFHNWAQNGQGELATGAFARGVQRGAGCTSSGSASYAANFDASRVARTADETRSKNIGATYYMRIR